MSDVAAAAGELRESVSLLVRRWKSLQSEGELTLPDTAALVLLDRGGPTTIAELARQEQITPQSMGATVANLEARGLVHRRQDPTDGRQRVLSLAPAGLKALRDRRHLGTKQIANALATEFSAAEVRQLTDAAPLIERLAKSI